MTIATFPGSGVSRQPGMSMANDVRAEIQPRTACARMFEAAGLQAGECGDSVRGHTRFSEINDYPRPFFTELTGDSVKPDGGEKR